MRPAVPIVAAAVLAGMLACGGESAIATPPQPANLRVSGGENTWHAENGFQLDWTNPEPGSGSPLVDVHYRLRDPRGNAFAEARIGRVTDGIAALAVPRSPGAYTVEVWLEDVAGAQGPPAAARLLFDNARPGPIEPVPVASWIGRTDFPLRISLGHPSGPMPTAGFRGYAVAIDADPARTPCAAPDRCTDAETTLRGGAGDDVLEVASLPEGTSYLHAVAVSGSGMKSATSSHTVLRVDTTDPVTRLAGAPAGWTNRTVGLIASASDDGSGMEPEGAGPAPFTAIRVDGGAPQIGPGATAAATVIDEGAHLVSYYARDAAGNVNDGGGGNGIANRPPRTSRVRIDRRPPKLAFTNSQDAHDPDLVRVRISDSLSGADTTRGWIGVRRAGSGDRFEQLPAVPPGEGELRARWSSDAYPAGRYEFQATGYDAAGNATITARRTNGAPMILSNPLKAATTLSSGFGGRLRERTVPYGRGVRVGGRLTTGIHSPLAEMPVRIVERFAGRTEPAERVSTVRTEADGTYSIRLAPGLSRDVSVSFDGSPTLSRSTGGPLRLGVRSAVRLRTSSAVAEVGGAPLIFRGRVFAAPGAIPEQGKSVQLQFRLPGQPWDEFRTIQTDRRGRFRYAYRFSDDDSRGVRFQFRALASAQDGWPYEPGGSRPAIVRGI